MTTVYDLAQPNACPYCGCEEATAYFKSQIAVDFVAGRGFGGIQTEFSDIADDVRHQIEAGTPLGLICGDCERERAWQSR